MAFLVLYLKLHETIYMYSICNLSQVFVHTYSILDVVSL